MITEKYCIEDEDLVEVAKENIGKEENEVLEKYKESVELNTDFSYLESYWRKGGTYELPVELVNDLTGRIEELVAEVKELNDSLIWWKNRYNANEKILERYRTDENRSSKKD